MLRSRICLLLLTLAFSGCSRIIVEKYDPATYADGIRFYRPQPYAIVSEVRDKDGKVTGNTMEIRYLPDYSEEYVLREEARIGTVTMKPTLTDGWNLTALDSTVDTKIPETIDALVGAAKLGMTPSIAKRGQTAAAIQPGLYKLVMRKDGLPYLVGPVKIEQGSQNTTR